MSHKKGPTLVEYSKDNLELRFWPGWLSEQDACRYFKTLREEILWEQGSIKLFDKTIQEPRLSAWYGDANAIYSYSGKTMQPHPWTPLLAELKTSVEAHTKTRFNSVLLNYYRNGSDSMGMHSDDEVELGPKPSIASVNLGASRQFDLKHKTLGLKKSINLAHGSLILMSGQMQKFWKHGIPKQKEIEEARINLTFRWVYPETV